MSAMRRLMIATSALAVLAPVAPLALLAPAEAGPAGSWTTITGPTAADSLGNTARPSAYRTADGVLHVVYKRKDSPSAQSLVHVALGDDGEVLSQSVIVSDWDALTADPEILPSATGLRVVFSGIRGGPSPDFYNGGQMYHAISSDGGATWSLQNTTLTESGSAYASYGTGATAMADGSAFVAFPLNTRLRYANVEYAAPDAAPADPGFDISDCCAYDVELARVPGTDAVWMAWIANGRTEDSLGVFVRQIAPTLGPVTRAPRSVTTYEGTPSMSSFNGGLGLVATTDGDLYVTYPVGYPTRKAVAVWKVGGGAPLLAPRSGDAQYGDLAVDDAGRLWLAWESQDVVRAVRSNPARTRFGAPVSLGAPREGGGPRAWAVVIDPSPRGNADVIANTDARLLHQEVFAGLTLTADPGAWDGDRAQRVTFRVTDAGVPVDRARVRAGGASCTTGADGRCTIRFAPSGPRGITATATATGYTADSLRLRVRP